MKPALLLVAHGSRDPRAGVNVETIASRVRRLRPELTVVPCYLDHAGPRPAAVLSRLPGPVVVLPLLLAAAYHASVDVAAVVAAAPGRAVSAQVLGPAPELLGIGQDLLRGAGVPGAAAVVLASAGTGRPEANAATAEQAEELAAVRGRPVLAAFATAAPPTVDEAIHQLHARGLEVAVLRWLLSPGLFADQIAASARTAGARCTQVLGAHPQLAALVLARYDEAAAQRWA